VINRLKPPPVLTDFAAEQKHLIDEGRVKLHPGRRNAR